MLKRLELFEHETVRVGQECGPAGKRFKFERRDFEALVRFNDQNDGVFFRPGHDRLTATSYVGYLEVGHLGVEILPKADRRRHASASAWRDGLLEMLGVASDLRLESIMEAGQTTARSSLIDIVATRFVEEVERLLHEGLAKGYREAEGNRTTFRGRLVFAQHIRENAARADRLFVRYGTYDHDVVVNRILGLALRAVGEMSLSSGVAGRAKRCRLGFPEVAPVRVSADLFDRLRLGRSTIRYERSLTLARMLLEHRAPELRPGAARVFALLFDMNVLWERYVSVLFRRAAGPDLVISTQERRGFWAATGYPIRRVRPDIVVQRRRDSRVVLVADTKWKVIGDGPPGDGDLKQMFVYNELFGAPRALLLYPATSASIGRTGSFARRPGASTPPHRCETIHLGVVDGEKWSSAGLRQQIEVLLLAASEGERATG